MEETGFEQGERVMHFIRYVMEKNNVCMEKYIRRHMNLKVYEKYKPLLKL